MENTNQSRNYNKFSIGLIVGLIVPILTMGIVFIYDAQRNGGFNKFLYLLKEVNENADIFVYYILPRISLCAIPNLLFFFLFMRKNYYQGGRGVILATILYTIVSFIIKFT